MNLTTNQRKVICENLGFKGVKSVILIGSRAIGNAKEDSDIDLYAVVPTLLTPFVFKKIRKTEEIIEKKLKKEVTIAPLTTSRIKYGDDLLLFKTKKEGKTIYGDEYISSINIDSINDIPYTEFFDYFFSSIYHLLKDFNIRGKIDDDSLYNTAKSVKMCSQLILMVNGIYKNNLEKIYDNISNKYDMFNLKILLDESRNILNRDNDQIENRDEFWFEVKLLHEEVYDYLSQSYLNVKNCSPEKKIDVFKNIPQSYTKNLQHFIGSYINKNKFEFSVILKPIPTQRYIYSSLYWLLLSLENEFTVNPQYIKKAIELLQEINIRIDRDKESKNSWVQTKNCIVDIWSFGCGKDIIGI